MEEKGKTNIAGGLVFSFARVVSFFRSFYIHAASRLLPRLLLPQLILSRLTLPWLTLPRLTMPCIGRPTLS